MDFTNLSAYIDFIKYLNLSGQNFRLNKYQPECSYKFVLIKKAFVGDKNLVLAYFPETGNILIFDSFSYNHKIAIA